MLIRHADETPSSHHSKSNNQWICSDRREAAEGFFCGGILKPRCSDHTWGGKKKGAKKEGAGMRTEKKKDCTAASHVNAGTEHCC